jgi:hypothetical protein
LGLSNNLAENSMRHIARGRPNQIHIWQRLGQRRTATILSVLEGCRQLKNPVRDYLATSQQDLQTHCPRIGSRQPRIWLDGFSL